MKFRISCVAAGLLFVLATAAQAQTNCGTNDFVLASDASVTQGLMSSPAKFEGPITLGNLAPGNWSVTIDDTGWPTSGSARRAHLKSMYVYDAGSATFTLTLPASKVDVMLAGPDQTFAGVATMTWVIQDDGNGAISNAEFNNAQTVGLSVDASCGSNGTAWCGGLGRADGSASPDLVTTPLAGALTTDPCVTAVERTPWAGVKKRFRD